MLKGDYNLNGTQIYCRDLPANSAESGSRIKISSLAPKNSALRYHIIQLHIPLVLH